MLIILLCLVLLLITLILLWWFQRQAIFKPTLYRDNEAITKLGLLYNEFDLATVDGKGIEGAIYTPENYCDTILYFGGQSQDCVGLMPKLVQRFKNYQILTFNYREYGKSSGILSEKRVCDDAIFIYDWVREFYGDVIVMGYSLGSYPASYIASQYNTKLLVLIAPFSSIQRLIKDKIMLPSKLIFFKFNTLSLIQKIDTPIIIFSSKDDAIIKPEYPLSLAKDAKNLRLHKELIGYNHEELLFSNEVEILLHKYRG